MGKNDHLSRRKAIMLVTRELLADMGWADIDPLKWDQAERDKLCKKSLLPAGTVLLDARWDALNQQMDQLAFLVTSPDFREVGEAEVLPLATACYSMERNAAPVFTGWKFYEKQHIPVNDLIDEVNRSFCGGLRHGGL